MFTQVHKRARNPKEFSLIVEDDRGTCFDLIHFLPLLSQVHSGDSADQLRQAQEQQSDLDDDHGGLADQRCDRHSDRPGPKQHTRPHPRPLRLLQL